MSCRRTLFHGEEVVGVAHKRGTGAAALGVLGNGVGDRLDVPSLCDLCLPRGHHRRKHGQEQQQLQPEAALTSYTVTLNKHF